MSEVFTENKIRTLKAINDKLLELSLDRSKLKTDLFSNQVSISDYDRLISKIELSAETEIYINDVEKKYNNELARKTAVKNILSSNEEYNRVIYAIRSLNNSNNEIEISLRHNQAMIDYNTRLYEINILSIKEGN